MNLVNTKRDIINAKALKTAVSVNSTNLASGIIYKHKELVYNSSNWHKFIVFHTEGLSRDEVLKTILNHVQPLDLIPVNYDQNHCNSYFLARNCGPAIDKLCRDNLVVLNPHNPAKPFKIQIVLKYSSINEYKIDVQANIMQVLNTNYDQPLKMLNLSWFYKNTELVEFCPLSQPKILYFVLHLAKSLQPTKINLSYNEISLLNPLESLAGANITTLDLSNNSISDTGELKYLKHFTNITNLKLKNNPFCKDITEAAYLELVRDHCPNIEKLDDIQVYENKIPAFRKDFFNDLNGVDLVNQFLEYFFTTFDSHNRCSMEGLYHKQALFSMTSNYHPYQSSSVHAHLKAYKTYSRNLVTIADFLRNGQNLYRGPGDIMNLFKILPRTEHDPCSFQVDLIYNTPNCAIIVINGIFRELPENLLDPERVNGFARHFVLESINNEYCIINDQLHVYNALTSQQAKAFTVSRPLRDNNLPPAQNGKQESQLIEAMQALTNLNQEWSKKLLSECKFDLKKTLSLFVDLYKVDKIPQDSFCYK